MLSVSRTPALAARICRGQPVQNRTKLSTQASKLMSTSPLGVLRVASPRSESFKLTHYDPTCSFRVPTTFTASADQFREQWEGHLQLLSKLSLDASESP